MIYVTGNQRKLKRVLLKTTEFLAANFESIADRTTDNLQSDQRENFHEFLRAYADIFTKSVTLDISVVLKFLKCVLNLSYLRNLLDFFIYSPYNILCNKICAKYIKMLQQECDLFFFSIKTDCDFIKVDNKKLLLLVNF